MGSVISTLGGGYRCSVCGKPVDRTAQVCPHCVSWLRAGDDPRRSSSYIKGSVISTLRGGYKCSVCGEPVDRTAQVCPHCASWLRAGDDPRNKKSNKRNPTNYTYSQGKGRSIIYYLFVSVLGLFLFIIPGFLITGLLQKCFHLFHFTSVWWALLPSAIFSSILLFVLWRYIRKYYIWLYVILSIISLLILIYLISLH